jgi:uncharacterized iron-regulated protein
LVHLNGVLEALAGNKSPCKSFLKNMFFTLKQVVCRCPQSIRLIAGTALFLFVTSIWSQGDWRSQVDFVPASELVLLGEQHDAPEHQELARLSLQALASKQQISALLLEMADVGLNTEGMAIESSESEVRQRLQWNDAGWPWSRYGPIVMQAVRVGVPVIGANVPRSAISGIMTDISWDTKVPSSVLSAHRESMVESHCGLLPNSQVPAMARIQIARDARMAQTAQQWMQKGKTVLLLAGAEHVKKDRGIPLFLDSSVANKVSVVWMQAVMTENPDPLLADVNWKTPPIVPKDYCAELAKSIKQ